MDNVQISDESVRKELSLILGFEEIRNSQVLSRFLEFVVEKKLLGQQDEIKEYTIAVKGLGKPSDFSPQLDACVRIHAGRLRRIITQYYQETGKDDAVFITIPKGTYVPVFTSRNGERHADLPLPSLRPQHATNGETVNGSEVQKKPVLAVLPFHNLSSENSKEYFVVGIGEQLTTDLARFQNISVISYFSTSTYNSELKDLQEMKKKANIDYVLTGSVRFINHMVKLNVHLILAENGEIIFTETHTRNLTAENIFDIQDEIVSKVLNVIADDNGIIVMNKAHASPFTKAETLSVQEAIYKYFDYTQDYNREKYRTALYSLERAIQTEPDNALASALLASLYMESYINDITEDRASLDKLMALAQLAVELDRHCQHAQRALAWAFALSGQKEKSFETIEQCINLNPKASSIIATMSLAYICQGDYNRGFKWLLESIHLNPAPHPNSKSCFILYYYHNGNYTESLKWLERMNPLESPSLKLLQLSLYGKIYRKKKNDIDKTLLDLKDQALSIIDRIVLDEKLRIEVIDGLQLAGLTVK